ncbi:hypothetical protein IGI04_003141 [Brassica rapa subsp. trilocularis]|uniref:Uncharacterized protein n=1 Tax=Brassica rapa subsp. trilocularis TaxID=1813537 RepID=A0ABQ7P0Y5_BRACM|nr:hypothetical protein IGI04_003141 [Brassica rapa subsp. trilocularis]
MQTMAEKKKLSGGFIGCTHCELSLATSPPPFLVSGSISLPTKTEFKEQAQTYEVLSNVVLLSGLMMTKL